MRNSLLWCRRQDLENAFVFPIPENTLPYINTSPLGAVAAQTSAEVGGQGISPADSGLPYTLKS